MREAGIKGGRVTDVGGCYGGGDTGVGNVHWWRMGLKKVLD